MKIFAIRAAAMLAVAMLPFTVVDATYGQGSMRRCANAGYDEVSPRERSVGATPYWSDEPTDCRTIWRHHRHRGTDPDPNIRLQLMRGR
jgi:hypothetical protein